MKYLFTAFFMLSSFCLQAQIFKKILDKTKQKTEDKISEKISEKASNAASRPIDDAGTKKKDKNKPNDQSPKRETEEEPGDDAVSTVNTGKKPSLSTYSKFDFVPGEKILAYEDFSQDALGDFPDKWNTNGAGDLVQVVGEEGKWLKINKKARFIPEFINSLPENFTCEFDLICNEDFSFYSADFSVLLLTGGASNQAFEYGFVQKGNRSGVQMNLHPHNAGNNGGTAKINSFDNGVAVIDNTLETTKFNSQNGRTKVRVSIWRQKQRIRMYVNEDKVFDLPKGLVSGKEFNLLMFELGNDMHRENDQYLLGNIKLAVGAPDTRNKLMTEGKFVTSGILFDVNSDKIKPESFGVLKEIAGVLKENEAVRVKILGHTDSDGEDQANLELSKKRSASVKAALAKEFGIAESRIDTDGMGEKQPLTNNTTAEGKANNRRVEFIKI
ncbi:MAG: OmpA family protein [Ginsengibacter sp.]